MQVGMAAVFVLLPVAFFMPVKAANCWAPDRMQEPDAAVARVAPVAEWRKDFAAVSAILKKLTTLEAIPDKRLGVSMYLGHPYEGFGNTARVSAGVYPKQAWEGECDLGKGAEFFNNGHVHVVFNEPRAIFEHVSHAVNDDSLLAYFEPKELDRIGAEVMYDHKVVILTPEQIAPWIDVTMDEYLRVVERQTEVQLAEMEKTHREAYASVADTAEAVEMIREMEKVNPQMARDMRASMEESRKMIAASLKETMPEYEKNLEALRKELSELRSHRAGMSSTDRSGPVYMGTGRWQLRANGDPERGKLVKLNPALKQPGKLSRRIQLIVVNPFANDQDLWDELTQATKEVDFAALRAMLR